MSATGILPRRPEDALLGLDPRSPRDLRRSFTAPRNAEVVPHGTKIVTSERGPGPTSAIRVVLGIRRTRVSFEIRSPWNGGPLGNGPAGRARPAAGRPAMASTRAGARSAGSPAPLPFGDAVADLGRARHARGIPGPARTAAARTPRRPPSGRVRCPHLALDDHGRAGRARPRPLGRDGPRQRRGRPRAALRDRRYRDGTGDRQHPVPLDRARASPSRDRLDMDRHRLPADRA